MNEKFAKDYFALYGEEYNSFKCFIRLLKNNPNNGLKYIYYGRKFESASNIFTRHYYKRIVSKLSRQYGTEIQFDEKIGGGGMKLIHPYGITVNPGAILGNNIVLFKGCTIGSVRSGKRNGIPVLEDNIVICPNAMVCGGIHIGSNVLIAANAFVDFDVPSNSIVLGNPAVIKPSKNPVKDYIRHI